LVDGGSKGFALAVASGGILLPLDIPAFSVVGSCQNLLYVEDIIQIGQGILLRIRRLGSAMFKC